MANDNREEERKKKETEERKINSAINYIIIAFVWEQQNAEVGQMELSKFFSLGVNAYSNLRNSGVIPNIIGSKRIKEVSNNTGIRAELMSGMERISIRGIKPDELEKYLCTLQNIYWLNQLKEGTSIVLADVNEELKKRPDLLNGRINEDTKDIKQSLKKAVGDRESKKKEFANRLKIIIKIGLDNVEETISESSDFDKLLYYIKFGRKYEGVLEELDKTITALEKTTFNILKQSSVDRLEKYVKLLRNQFSDANALLIVRKHKN